MLPPLDAAFTAADLRPGEYAALFECRRLAIEEAVSRSVLDGTLPVPWRHGWRASVRYLGRDRDGSRLNEITVTGPQLDRPYVRRVRLVPRRALRRA